MLTEVVEIGTLRYLKDKVGKCNTDDQNGIADTLEEIHEELDLGHITVEARDQLCVLLAEKQAPPEWA